MVVPPRGGRPTLEASIRRPGRTPERPIRRWRVPNSRIHTVLNWTGTGTTTIQSCNPNPPSEFNSFYRPRATLCDAKMLEVKLDRGQLVPAREPHSVVPPTLSASLACRSRSRRHHLGLLPIAVRVPKPVSVAAIFYDESSGNVKAVKYFCQVDHHHRNSGGPAGLDDDRTARTTSPRRAPGRSSHRAPKPESSSQRASGGVQHRAQFPWWQHEDHDNRGAVLRGQLRGTAGWQHLQPGCRHPDRQLLLDRRKHCLAHGGGAVRTAVHPGLLERQRSERGSTRSSAARISTARARRHVVPD